MSDSLKNGGPNERAGSQYYVSEGLGPKEPTKPSSNSTYGRDSGALRPPRSNASRAYATPYLSTRDTALQDYTPSSSLYAPDGYMSSRPQNGSRHPAYPPPLSRSSAIPPSSSSRARPNYDPPLSPTSSPTSRSSARRPDSPPASVYFSAEPSSQDKLTPAPGHARDLGEHFSFSTTLRRHALGPTEDILPSFGRGGGISSGASGTVEGRLRAFLEPALQTLGIGHLLFPRREDEEMNTIEFGSDGLGPRSSSPAQDHSTPRETVSAKYAPMPVKVVLNILFLKFCLP
jgi:hypothetical protein